MLNITDSDKQIVKDAYEMILFNLKNHLQKYNVKNELEYVRIIFSMLHEGFFSMTGTIRFDNNYDYLRLPIEFSQGVQVMHGICCCRHASEFLYNVLCILNFHPSFIYFWVDNDTEIWRKVNPNKQKANHQAILLNAEEEFIIDPAKKFILQVEEAGQVKSLNSEYSGTLKDYQEENIATVGRVLKKYYTYKELGVKRVY